MRAEATERPVQRQSRPGQSVIAEELGNGQGIFGLRHRMQVPAVQLAELLAELAEVEPDVAGQSGPVGVAFLDADMAALEADEDLGV